MKKMKFNFLFIALLFASLQSCTDDLNVKPEDDDVFLSDKFFASSPTAYKQALAGIYGNLSLTGAYGNASSNLEGIDAGTSQYGRCLWYMENLTTDEVIWSYENDAGTRDLQRNVWTADNPILLGMFSRTMLEVSFSNEFLRQTTPSKLSSRGVTDPTMLADIETYRNEVRTLRAYAYYVMMDLYGKAPMVTENDPINFMGPEFNRQQLFDFIESELTAVMPNLKPARSNEYGRLDQAFAHMVLAKIYLNAEVYTGANKYSECVTECAAVIGGGYTLNTNYLHNFNADNQSSPEMIFTLQSDGAVTQTYGATTVMVNGEVGSIEQNGVALGVSSGAWGGALRLRRQFVEKFQGDEFANDARNTILPPGTRPIDITNIANQAQGYILAKFSNVSSAGIPGVNQTFVDTDFPLFRLADAYLMYAEATLRGGSGSQSLAMQYVNALRERANNGSTAADIGEGDLTLDFILDERARELHWEAHRRQDLIRFGKYTGGSYNWAWKGNSPGGVSIPATLSVFPIPNQSLASNSNLTQNPGY